MRILKDISREIYALSVLSGTIIGVGLFSLPYITVKVGIWVIVGYFLILGTIAIIVHRLFVEISLKTPDFLRLPSFARIYLGKRGEIVALTATVLGFFGAILAYIIVGGEFLNSLLSPVFGGTPLIYALFYFAFGAILIYFGIKAVSRFEFWGLVFFFIILIFIFFRVCSFSLLKTGNFLEASEPGNLFLPYGPILFSLWGAALIPEAEEILGEHKEKLRKIIPIAIFIPIIVSLFFIFIVVGVTGSETTESALTGLRMVLGDNLTIPVLLFGLITTFTSFIALGLTLKKIFWYDLKIGEKPSWAITCFVPFILFLVGIQSFIKVISVVGGVMIGVEGILILLMYRKIKPGKKLLVLSLILLFLGGIIYEIIYFLK